MNEGHKSEIERLRVPILVGITGHRDIADEPKLLEDISAVFNTIAGKYPASPIVLLTPLGEGADRTAAKAVNSLRLTGMNIRYLTILPMAEGEYTKTFADASSVEEYFALKNQGMGCQQIPVPDSVCGDSDLSHEQLYANLGAYLAQHTQVLIAAWNGAEEDAGRKCSCELGCLADGASCPQLPLKLGGTYHVLRMRFFGVEDDGRRGSYLANREFGPVYWIKSKRISSDYMAEGESIAGPAYPRFPLNPGQGGDLCHRLVKNCFPEQVRNASVNRTYDKVMFKLDAYNLDISVKYAALSDQIQASKEEFCTSALGNLAPLGDCNVVSQYSAADCLSVYYQSKRRMDIIFLVALAFLGLLSYSLYSGPLVSYLFILGYTALYLAGCLFYLFRVKANRHHEKYVDYRGIAEGLRVQFFWGLAGVSASVPNVFLGKQKGSVSWIKTAINNCIVTAQAQKDRLPAGSNAGLELAEQLWLRKQRDYYDRKHPRKSRADTAQKGLEAVLFATGLAAAVFLAGIDTLETFAYGTSGVNAVFSMFGSSGDYMRAHQWLVFSVGFLPVIIASYKVFTELMAYAKLARNFKWMRLVYSVGLNEFTRIRSCPDTDTEVLRKCRKLLYDIGVEALAENEEWIGILDDRVPELPK